MKATYKIGIRLCLILLPWLTVRGQVPVVHATVDFGKKLQVWDGFGAQYVQVHHTRDFKAWPEDYGGLSHLNEDQRQQVIQLVFGADGLKPGIVKAWVDPFHQPVNDNDDPYTIDLAKFDHETTTKWVMYFCKRGLTETRKRGDDLNFLVTLHGAPGWVTKQKALQGPDLDSALKLELAKYIASWAKYLRDIQGLPVKYLSPMNEGEDRSRWPADGTDPVSFWAFEHNLYWPEYQIVDFLHYAREVLDRNGMKEVGLTNGEPTYWGAFYSYKDKSGRVAEYARRIREDSIALKNLALITSHGFGKSYDPRGIDLIHDIRPDLHAWTTSGTWGDMSVDILEDFRQQIYTVKVNALMPFAMVHNDFESDKLSYPANWRISSNFNSPIKTNNGRVEVTKAYYHYKQVSRAGQPGTAVASVSSDDPQLGLIAFTSNGTRNGDAFTVINLSKSTKRVSVTVVGATVRRFVAHLTTDTDYCNRNYEPFTDFRYDNGTLEYTAPPRSSTGFVSAR